MSKQSNQKNANESQKFEKNIWTRRREWVRDMEALHAAEAKQATQQPTRR